MPLSVTALRELARLRRLELGDEDLERLRPMVQDLLAVAERLRESVPDPHGVEQTAKRQASP
jgi:hypothetical protein